MSKSKRQARDQRRPVAPVERAATGGSSRQPERTFWSSTVDFVNSLGTMPRYDRNNMHNLDDWCRNCLMREPYLGGFVNKVVSAQANRGWALYGGKRIVQQTAQLLHRFDPTSIRLENGQVIVDEYKAAGWRKASKRRIMSYLTRNAGAFVEIQYRLEPRFNRNGWTLSNVVNLYSMDTKKVEWLQDPLYPLRYDGSKSWPSPAFYHLVASPSDVQELYNYGTSPLFRCIRLAQLMVNINEWEVGTLSDDFVDAVLLLNGTSVEEFNNAMAARKIATVNGNKAKRAAVIGNANPDIELTAEILHLRNKPASLDNFEQRIHLLLQGYAVNLGYALGNFIESAGAPLLGKSGTEVDNSERTTSEAGGNDFHLEDQAAINNYVVPASIEFLYDETDVDDRSQAEVQQIRSAALVQLFTAARGTDNLGTAEQFQTLMVEQGLVPPEWTTSFEEDIELTDVEQARILERQLSIPAVQRFVHGVEQGQYRDDALVAYHYDPVTEAQTQRTILPSVQAMLDSQSRTFAAVEIPTPQNAPNALLGGLVPVEPLMIDPALAQRIGARIMVPGWATTRATDTQKAAARQQLIQARTDARAITEVILP